MNNSAVGHAARYDTAVIGGGPAGCSAAITLAERGLKVILLEAKTYPHDKLCGEFLSPECAGLLDRLGMNQAVADLGPVTIQKTLLTAPDGNAWESRLPAPALGISRRALDAALATRARQVGVTLWEASTVSGVAGNLEDGFNLAVDQAGSAGTLEARSVIAAHGKRGALDRVLKRKFFEQHHPFVAIKAHFHGPRIPGRIELHAFPGGYCGMSEIEGDARVVCLLVHESVFRSKGGRGPEALDRFICWMRGQNLYLDTWMQWASRIHDRWITIAQVPFVHKPVMAGDVLTAGDAAGLIVPLAGNGIAMALDGGMLAAENLADYLTGERTASALRRDYPDAWLRRIGMRLRLGQAIQPLMLNPRAVSLVLKTINAFPGIGRFLIEHTRGPSSAAPTHY